MAVEFHAFISVVLWVTNFWPLKLLFDREARKWRVPAHVPPFDAEFTPRLKQGEVIHLTVSFFIPHENQTDYKKTRITTAVQASLAKHFSARLVMPSYDEIQPMIDAPLDEIAKELKLLIFYAHIRDCYNDRNQKRAVLL